MVSVTIPSTVISIGIISIILYRTITTINIGNYAFYSCPFTCIANWNPTITRTIGTSALPTTTTCGIIIFIIAFTLSSLQLLSLCNWLLFA